MDFSSLYQTFVLFALYRSGVCDQSLQYKLETISIIIEGINIPWNSISICKYSGRDTYFFSSKDLNDLCDGEFSSGDIEIVVLIEQTMRFTLSRPGGNIQLHFNVLFPTNVHTQMFYRDIRHEQRFDCGLRIDIKKIFKYPKNRFADEDMTLTPLSNNSFFYKKRMDPDRFEYPVSLNFVRILSRRTQEADLIIQPRTFNISRRLNGSKYVLCTYYDQFSVYVLLFHNETNAGEFSASVASYVNLDIICTADWLTPELLRQIDSPRMSYLPHLPYLG